MPEAADIVVKRLSILREVNDFVLGLQLRFGTDRREHVGFLCECADARCTALVMLSCDAYRTIRSRGGYVLSRGHVHDAA
jgi:hypothetical protein